MLPRADETISSKRHTIAGAPEPEFCESKPRLDRAPAPVERPDGRSVAVDEAVTSYWAAWRHLRRRKVVRHDGC